MKPSLIYIIGTYPLLTTTFIDREIKILRRWGVDIQIISIRRPPAGTPFSRDQLQLQEGVLYLLPPDWWQLIASHLVFALGRPGRYFGTLFYLVSRPHPSWRARLKTLLHFGEGVYAAYQLRGREFQEMHAHFVDRAATLALVAGRLLGKPYSLSIHASENIFVHPILMPEKIAGARHIATCTHFNKQFLEGLLGRNLDDKISLIYHGLDVDAYTPPPRAGRRRPLILAVGQLAERKGFSHLIEACRCLKERGYEFCCQIVGTGPEKERLEALIRRHGLADSVALCGALSHDDVIGRYREATLFALPCIESRDGNLDGIPNVLAEAMAMELPVISTRVSAIPELVVDGENGLLVEPGDDPALAQAIASLLDRPALGAALGQAGRQTVLESFDVAANVRRLADTLWPDMLDPAPGRAVEWK